MKTATDVGLQTWEADVTCGVWCQGGYVRWLKTDHPQYTDASDVWVRGDDAIAALESLRAELETMREALALHEVGSAYAHRLAVMLECALLDPTGTWNEAHALLDEYRAACRAAAPMQEPPTFMGEPVVMPNAKVSGGGAFPPSA